MVRNKYNRIPNLPKLLMGHKAKRNKTSRGHFFHAHGCEAILIGVQKSQGGQSIIVYLNISVDLERPSINHGRCVWGEGGGGRGEVAYIKFSRAKPSPKVRLW